MKIWNPDPVALDSLIDAIAETKTSLLLLQHMVVAPQRREEKIQAEIQRLAAGVVCIRAIVTKHFNTPDGLPRSLRNEIEICERGFEQFQGAQP